MVSEDIWLSSMLLAWNTFNLLTNLTPFPFSSKLSIFKTACSLSHIPTLSKHYYHSLLNMETMWSFTFSLEYSTLVANIIELSSFKMLTSIAIFSLLVLLPQCIPMQMTITLSCSPCFISSIYPFVSGMILLKTQIWFPDPLSCFAAPMYWFSICQALFYSLLSEILSNILASITSNSAAFPLQPFGNYTKPLVTLLSTPAMPSLSLLAYSFSRSPFISSASHFPFYET